MALMDEAQHIAKAKSGNQHSMGLLYDMYVKDVYRFVYFKTHHQETTEDLVSDIFMKVVKYINTFDQEKASFKTWVIRIARNVVIDHYRKKELPQTNIEDAWDITDGSKLDELIGNKIDVERVQQELQKLSAIQRDVIVLRLWDGLSHDEIATILDISPANSRVQLMRGMKTLRAETIMSLCLLGNSLLV